jgi:hypothetical protein
MYKIVCDYCDEDIDFNDPGQRPETCHNCNSFIGDLKAQQYAPEGENKNERKRVDVSLPGLTLIYQKTGEEILMDGQIRKTIIGREYIGKEVLEKILQISRKHCVIDFVENQYTVTDCGSTHGTYLGISLLNCRINPGQILEDNGLLFLGKEPFLVKINTVPVTTNVETGGGADKTDKGFRCKYCGVEFDEYDQICPQCGTYGSLESF